MFTEVHALVRIGVAFVSSTHVAQDALELLSELLSECLIGALALSWGLFSLWLSLGTRLPRL